MAGKERSPNYPGMGLEAAVEAIKRVYAAERRSAAPTQSVAKALGHDSLSGPALTKLAALRQFGFLEDVARGKVKVSDDAMPLVLRGPQDAEFSAVIRDAALRPPLFRELYDNYAQGSDDTLRYHLIKDRGFSDEGAAKVIKSFRATLSFVGLDSESYAGTSNDIQTEAAMRRSESFVLAPDHPVKRHLGGGVGLQTMSFNWLLPGGVRAYVAFQGAPPTPRAVDRLIDYLKFMKDDLPVSVEDDMAPGKSSRLRDLEAEDEA